MEGSQGDRDEGDVPSADRVAEEPMNSGEREAEDEQGQEREHKTRVFDEWVAIGERGKQESDGVIGRWHPTGAVSVATGIHGALRTSDERIVVVNR